jgi:hypothetical protein
MRTDDMVREALADLAPVAPADSSALAGMHRAIGRRRRRQQVARIAAAVTFVALAVGAGAVVLQAEGDPADVSTEPDDGKPTTDTTGEPKPDLSDRIDFGGVSFRLPAGWEASAPRKETDPLGDAQGETLCIAPVGNEGPQWEDCAGLLIHSGDFLPGNEMEPYQPHAPWAWYHATDVASCPAHPDAVNPLDGVQAPDGMDPIDQGTRPVGGRSAEYDRWSAQCELSGFRFEPQAWYVPESQLLVFDIFGHPETEDFLASFEFDG